MKLFVLFFLTSILANPIENNKLDLLCHKWIAVGGKSFGHEPEFSKSFAVMPIRIWFRNNGTCDKEQNFYGPFIQKGLWKFSTDSSKVFITITGWEAYGDKRVFEPSKYNTETDTIIKLTADTLILGQFYYSAPDSLRVHHDFIT